MKPSDFQPIASAMDRLATAMGKGWLDYTATIAVVLTLVVLIWYTVETYLLRKAAQKQIEETDKLLLEAQKQNLTAQEQTTINANLLSEAQRQTEISIQPVFAVFKGTSVNNMKGRIMLENVGKGAAFNTTIGQLTWDNKKLEFDHESTVMKPGDAEPLLFHLWADEIIGEHIYNVDRLIQIMNAKEIPDPFRIIVKCADLGLTPYEYFFDFHVTDGQRLNVDTVLNRNSRRGFSV
jgi:hypothetical protein